MNFHLVRLFLTLLVLILFPHTGVAAQPDQGKHVVIIDAAHGGTDLGVKLTQKEYEKSITLAISLLVKKELDKSGNVKVQLIRSTDRDISLTERKKVITEARSEVFVSVHINAGFGKNSTGYELYFPGFKSAEEEKSNSKEIIKDMAKNKYLNDSVKLAQLIQKNMDSVFPRKSRGLRNAPVTVLEGISIPAVVVEIGFATNPDDRKKMMDGNTQAAIAHALSQSIKDYF
jgi:N-acetylmuramoyl-L-alanine amidase